jgi:hypothetical protein
MIVAPLSRIQDTVPAERAVRPALVGLSGVRTGRLAGLTQRVDGAVSAKPGDDGYTSVDNHGVEIVGVAMKDPLTVHCGMRGSNSGVEIDGARNDAQVEGRERHQEISVGHTDRCSPCGGSVCRRTVKRDGSVDIASRGGIVPYRNGEGNGFPAHDGSLVFMKTYSELALATPCW